MYTGCAKRHAGLAGLKKSSRTRKLKVFDFQPSSFHNAERVSRRWPKKSTRLNDAARSSFSFEGLSSCLWKGFGSDLSFAYSLESGVDKTIIPPEARIRLI